jgi:hypothetical protein
LRELGRSAGVQAELVLTRNAPRTFIVPHPLSPPADEAAGARWTRQIDVAMHDFDPKSDLEINAAQRSGARTIDRCRPPCN